MKTPCTQTQPLSICGVPSSKGRHDVRGDRSSTAHCSLFTAHGPIPARRGGFTLVEMLVVVIIIGILAGIVLGLFKISGQWTAREITNEHLGKVRAAIEEFYATYGTYPPVPSSSDPDVSYEYPSPSLANSGAYADIMGNNRSSDISPLFTFGLMSFLVPRFAAANKATANYPTWGDTSQWKTQNASSTGDNPNDVTAAQRFNTYIGDIIKNGDPKPEKGSAGVSGVAYTYTNSITTVYDGWNRSLCYTSAPPYKSYRLWSKGPDGLSGTADDISTGPGF